MLSYPSYILRTVPPDRLLQVVASRAGQTLLRAVWRPAVPSAGEVLRGMGAPSLEDLPASFAKEIPGDWIYSSPGAVLHAMERLATRLPAEKNRAIAVARTIANGRIEIFGKLRSLKRSHGRIPFADPTWTPVDWEDLPGWEKRRDPKFPWALGRLEHVVRLAIASRLLDVEGRASEAEALGNAALDWMVDLASAPLGVQWTCPMEVALRGANMAIALRLLAGTPILEVRPGALCRVLQSIEFHSAQVSFGMEDTVVVPNNHLLSNVVGLLSMGALIPGLSGARERAASLPDRLFRLIMEQTLADGFTFEGSVGYHRLAVELVVFGVLSSRALGSEPPPTVMARIASMFLASEALRDGKGETPQIGDMDSGRALPFRSRPSRDHSHLPSLGAGLLFGGISTKGESVESLLLFRGGIADTRENHQREVSSEDSALVRAGIYLLRSRRLTCSVSCGPNGTGGTGTHGHNDKLALEICVDGERIVVDPGSGVYTSDPWLRNRFRGTALHSTAMVDGEEQQELPLRRLFALPEQAHARCLVWERHRDVSRFVGEHEGYLRLPQPVVHRRQVVLDKKLHRIHVTDTFVGHGRHQVEVRYLFPFSRRFLRVRKISSEERMGLGRTLRWVVEVLRKERAVPILASASAPELEDGVFAEGYADIRVATIAVIRREGALPLSVRSLFAVIGKEIESC